MKATYIMKLNHATVVIKFGIKEHRRYSFIGHFDCVAICLTIFIREFIYPWRDIPRDSSSTILHWTAYSKHVQSVVRISFLVSSHVHSLQTLASWYHRDQFEEIRQWHVTLVLGAGIQKMYQQSNNVKIILLRDSKSIVYTIFSVTSID